MVVTGKAKKVTTKKTTSRKVSNATTQAPVVATFMVVSEKVKAMSPEEFRMSLVKAGIIGINGKLTSKYKNNKKK